MIKKIIIAIAIIGASIGVYAYRKKLQNKVQGINPIIIGDSQSFLIAQNSSKADTRNDLAKVGWNTTNLLNAVNSVQSDDSVTHVFICIGTNSGYNKSDNIEALVDALQTKFPKATLFVIGGSTGWGNVTSINPSIYNSYYNRFIDKGVYLLENTIGYSKQHPTTYDDNIKAIGNEIDNILM